MCARKVLCQIFVYVVIVCPLFGVDYAEGRSNHFSHKVEENHQHLGAGPQKPCDLCPRGGRCVPRVQCPAHVRPGSVNVECHIGKTGLLGICCTTGTSHAAAADHVRARSTTSLSAAEVKASHSKGQQSLNEWLSKADHIFRKTPYAVVNQSSPSYGHHLSLKTHDKAADALGRGGLLNLLATHDLKARQALSDEQLQLGLTAHTDTPFCPPPPPCPKQPAPYRTIGGECNNPAAPSWGGVHTAYERLLPPDYSDGVWAMRSSKSGLPLPSARTVSTNMLLDADMPSQTNNMVFMQLGQFIAHDTTSAVVFTIGEGSPLSCCSGDGTDVLPPDLQHWACAPIIVGPEDGFYQQFQHHCINFVRAQLAPASDCAAGYAKQMNGVTHFMDLSQLYGSSIEKTYSLRAPNGLLNTFMDYGRELPPLTNNPDCLMQKEGAACFDSGDSHGNQVISLTMLHTIFTREHNRVARALGKLNPVWSEETIFFETRRIIQAEYQHIVFNEWIPLLLGPRNMLGFDLVTAPGYATGYDPHINPSLTAEFSTAAFRFGHSIVDGKITVPNTKTGSMYETISLAEVMFEPSRLRLRQFLDRILVGMSWQPMQSVDPFVTESLTRYLFHGGNPFGLDLASINVQRGRDYGIRSYNEYRKLAGLPPYNSFNEFPPRAAERLASVYATPDDIDLWIGGLLEEPVSGGVVGPTFANIIADQFSRSKKGDRYFYAYGPEVNPGAFKLGQLAEIKKVTMSRIICDNKDGIELMMQPPHAFLRADIIGNEPVPCDSLLIPKPDLNAFRSV